jgi:hypothetical protein
MSSVPPLSSHEIVDGVPTDVRPPSTSPFVALYAAWMSVPAPMREPIKSFTVSAFFGSLTAIGTLGSAYFTDHPWRSIASYYAFASYLASPHALGAIALAIGAAYRARQGLKAAKAANP